MPWALGDRAHAGLRRSSRRRSARCVRSSCRVRGGPGTTRAAHRSAPPVASTVVSCEWRSEEADHAPLLVEIDLLGRGHLGRPGMVMMSPQIITTNSAPAASRTSRTLITWPEAHPALRVGRERVLRLRHAHRVVAEAVLLQLLDPGFRTLPSARRRRAVDLRRDLLHLVPQRVAVFVDELVRGCAGPLARSTTARASSRAPLPPSAQCVRRPPACRASDAALQQVQLGLGVGGEVVDRDHAGQAVVLADVADVALEVGDARLQRRQVLLRGRSSRRRRRGT
jgi:hypothetical protein